MSNHREVPTNFIVGEVEEREWVRLVVLQGIAQLRDEGVGEAIVAQLEHVYRISGLDGRTHRVQVGIIQLAARHTQRLKVSRFF